jgi:transposase, IS5 family
MRNVINPQMLLDGVDIGAIDLTSRSRDDIPQILRGLQHIYTEPGLRDRVFTILQEVIPNRAKGEGNADAGTGRPGMEQWRILVLGVFPRRAQPGGCAGCTCSATRTCAT